MSIQGMVKSRNPADGKKQLVGFFLQSGETEYYDIQELPQIRNLAELVNERETQIKDAVDVEFSVVKDTVYITKVSPAKRRGLAALRIAVELVESGVISKKEAITRIQKTDLEDVLLPVFKSVNVPELGQGIGASTGCACGIVCFDNRDAIEQASQNVPVILVKDETNPEDVSAMQAAKGILAAKGGTTSHAAIVARGWGKPCIVGGNFKLAEIEKHSWMSIDGKTGKFYNTQLEVISAAEDNYYFQRFMRYCEL